MVQIADPTSEDDMAIETRSQEFTRLVAEYQSAANPFSVRGEAWNLIADFAVENAAFLRDALNAYVAEKPAPPADMAIASDELIATDDEIAGQFIEHLHEMAERNAGHGGKKARTEWKAAEFIRALLARLDAAERREKGLREDAARLDWLESVNLRMNERNGSVYGWQYDINHNRAALTDHNLPALTIREAIDSARFPEMAGEIRNASLKEGARLKAFDERFPGERARARAALEAK